MRKFTEQELAQYNGKNGRPVYVGYREEMYDLSSSFLWREGNHQVLHNGGADLTSAIEQAPHTGEVLKKFPVVGILESAHTSKKPPET